MTCIGVAVAARIMKGVVDGDVLSACAGISLFFAVIFDGIILTAVFS